MKRLLLLLKLIICLAVQSKAQILHPVKWSYGAKRINATEAVIFFKATINDGWHIYSQNVQDGGPIKTSFTFNPAAAYVLVGHTTEPRPVSRFEKAFSMNVTFFEGEVIFQQKIKLKKAGQVEVKGTLEYMTCNDKQCLPPENIGFNIPVK